MNKYLEKMKALFKEIEAIRTNAEKEERAMNTEEIKLRTDKQNEIEAIKAEMDSIDSETKLKDKLFGDDKTNRKIVDDPNDNQKPKEKEPVYKSLGEQLQDVVAVKKSPFSKEGIEANTRLTEVVAATGASISLPSDGGFLIDTQFSTNLAKGVQETGKLVNRCFKIPLSGNNNGIKLRMMDETSRANGSRFGGIQVYWTDEGGTTTKSKPKLKVFDLSLSKIMGLMYATDELLQDASALESAVMQWFPNEFGFELDDTIINGTGAGQPLGLLNAAATVSVDKEDGQAATTIVPDNMIKMYSRFSGNLSTSAWFINRDVIPQLYTMAQAVGTSGPLVFMPANQMTGKPFNTLLGLPIIEVEQCATIGTVGDIILADLSQYALIDKGGINAASSMHVQFLTEEMTFRWTYRVNGKPLADSPLTPFKGTGNTRSPFITLATRA